MTVLPPLQYSGGRYDFDVLEAYIRQYPETAFLILFRMYHDSFWHIVDIMAMAVIILHAIL